MTSKVDRPSLDVAHIIQVLASHAVDYLLVGGIAAAAHGDVRSTFDVDCLPRQNANSLERLAAAMRELRARLHVEGLDEDEAAALPMRLDADTLARMEISTWRTDAGNLDILADLPDRQGRRHRYDELVE